MGSKFKIRPMEIEDLEEVLRLEYRSFAIPWSRETYSFEIESNPMAHYLVLEDGERIIGYGGIWKILDEGHITNICIDEDYRGRGWSSKLMEKLIEKSQELGIKALTLEVRESNSVAIGLYSKFGFKADGIRKNYYTDNKEDAIIMWKYMEER